jgi:uncharacterized membrane-anchored protein
MTIAAIMLWLAGASCVQAQSGPPPQTVAEINAAWMAAEKTAVYGPRAIRLLDQAQLQLGPDQVFIPAAEANRIMTSLGNPSSPRRYGLIISRRRGAPWMVDVGWTKEGYIRDGDAKEWKPDELLANLKQGTEAGNSERVARGLPALDVIGWVEKPNYDPVTHRLLWSLAVRERNAPANLPQSINYNTYALGREGYFALDLITGSDSIAADKVVAHRLLGSLAYLPGKRYEDFNGSTDKVAAYGLAALIGAVAAKKLGLLAIIGLFLVKVWKLSLIALAGGMAWLRRRFRRRHAEAETQTESEVEDRAGETALDAVSEREN